MSISNYCFLSCIQVSQEAGELEHFYCFSPHSFLFCEIENEIMVYSPFSIKDQAIVLYNESITTS